MAQNNFFILVPLLKISVEGNTK